MPSIDPSMLPTVLGWLSPIIAEDAPAGGNPITSFVPIILIIVIFYFILIRPASRERKEREARVKGIEKHDKIVTNGGIHGVVVAMDEDTVTLKVDDKNNIRIKFSRQAIWQVESSNDKKSDDKKGGDAESK